MTQLKDHKACAMKQATISKTEVTTFTWADSWVLASVAVGGGLKGCQLKDIIAAGDLINRAVISPSELRSALGKLIHKGYVRRGGRDFFVIAGDVRYAVEQLVKQRAASFSVMQFFEEFLEVDAYEDRSADTSGMDYSLWDLSDAQVEESTRAYREELTSLWRELRQIDMYSLPERAMRLLEQAGKVRKG
jgi:hypothetical protein